MFRIATLAACSALALGVALPAQAAGEAATAAKTAAKTAAVSKAKSKVSKAAKPAPAAAAPAPLTESQLAVAKRVHTGQADCEFDQHVDVEPVAGREGAFSVGFKKAKYTMVPEDTTTGAVRLEDKKAGVMWLQIANKSMLMNSKIGQRMVDNCVHAAQK
ncbi:hypothetical protein BurJ1DRAFT_2080 [Burkholderiales bacterium JOSHI_001]|nr:hypothetical protein BurJ1DRAFT_2080 [Burkholderiales bacterium JOSHI_001]